MRRILGCFIILMIMMTSQIFAGTVYYVDATNGNDLYDGLSEVSAWKTIAKVNAQSFSPGDSILFKRGEIWREQLIIPSSGSSGSPITFGAYGSGSAPIINGSDLITGWTNHSGNQWKATCNTEPSQVFFDGTRGNEQSSLEDVDSEYDWYWASYVIYVYSTSDPDTAYTSPGIEASIRTRSIHMTNKDNITIENLELRYAAGTMLGVIDGSDSVTINNCHIHHAGGSGIIFWGTSTQITEGLISNCNIHDNNNNGIYMGQDTTGPTGVIIEYNTISDNGTTPLLDHGIYLGCADNNTIRYNSISGSAGNGAQFQYGSDSNEFYYNISYENGMSGLWLGTGDGADNCEIYNNTFYNNRDFGIVIGAGVSKGNIIKNNIFHQDKNVVGRWAAAIRMHDAADIPNNTFDYNCYYYANKGDNDIIEAGIGATTWYTLSEWQALGSSPDPNSINQNTLFVDTSNNDFRLQFNSLCIDTGTDVGLTQDYAGNTVPFGLEVDIGAYEYTGASPLNANINASPNSGEVPLSVNFTGNATGGTQSYSYSWDFGDSTSSSEQNPSHTYNDAGDFTVTLTVTDSQSSQDTDSLIINASAPATPLVASCAASPTSGEIPLTINFTGSATGGTEPYTYSWDFGDSASSSEQNPSHTYSNAGDYTVTLTVTDSQSSQDTDSFTINASAVIIPLQASFIASPTSGEVPLTVNFTGSATGGVLPYSYSWDFGDSTSSSEQNPSHTYNDAGDFTVTLTVIDSQSNQDTDSLTINASAPATPLVASCAGSPTSGEIPLIVNFTGNATGGTPPYNYNWDFGDGNSDSGKNPSHPYSQAGDYTVTFTVTDKDTNQDTDSLIINAYAPGTALVASCAASPTSGEIPLTVNFTGSATGGVLPYSYSWDFGDGTSSSDQNPSHAYNDAGDYAVYLTVTDSESNQDNDSLTINASALTTPLAASFIASPISGKAPLTVNFTGSATGGVPPYSYNWDFGDSTSSSEQNPSHTYSDAGDYTVTFTVTDSQSNQDSYSLIINVSAPAASLEASCAAYPTSGEVPLTVNFTGNASGGMPPYSYSWDFGDGTSSSEQIPSHTYSQAGDYTVTLTVTDSESNQDNDSLAINASAPANPLVASCTASPVSGEVPLTVNFTGIATGGTEPYTYSWVFGDSTSSSEQNPSHTYSQAGDYTVTLTVTDSQSNQDNDSLTINASTPAASLEASCAASSTSGEVPLTVNFTGIATGGVLPYSYSWDFGDGTSSSEQNPIYTYSQAGDYTAYLTVTDSESNQDNDSLTINASAPINSAYLSCSPQSLYFGATNSGNETGDQYLRIINGGSGTLTWNIEDDAGWLSCSPSSGTDRGEITVSVDSSGLSLGLYVATITVSSPEAYNSPQYVSVNLRVYESEQESPPFGSLDTPVDGSTVSGSIPIAGWALDDIEVVRLEIKRSSDPVDPPEAIDQDGLVYIGDAVFVEGARPDAEESYPDYPLNSRAGWGYTLLTNDLPYRGNGSFTIYTFAYDASGHREEIGRKTILCDNINRIKPFGTIDTPAQGESIGGSDYIKSGWALTPLPKTIPKDGSTIWVSVDGVQIGHPVYDQYREDIATLYPEYNNAQGAVGYYHLDTTQYENGMHTITWSVMDDEGEVDEIGARYFFIDNIETGSAYHGSLGLRSIYREDVEGRLRIGIKEVGKEYGPQVDDDRKINRKSILNIQIEEMEPLRIVLEESSGGNMEYIGWGEDKWKALPIGSTLDREKGIFSWIPTPGFIGRYVFHFAVTDGSYLSKPLQVVVNVIPKSYD